MRKQLQTIAAIAVAAALFMLANEQRGVAHHKPVEMAPELVRSLKARLEEAEARTASAEAKASALAQRVRELAQPAAAAAAASMAVASLTGLPPAQQQNFIHTTTSLPAKSGDLMMMTYATGGVKEMLTNWVRHVQRLGLPELVAAMDKDVVMQCGTEAFHCLDWSHTATGNGSARAPTPSPSSSLARTPQPQPKERPMPTPQTALRVQALIRHMCGAALAGSGRWGFARSMHYCLCCARESTWSFRMWTASGHRARCPCSWDRSPM